MMNINNEILASDWITVTTQDNQLLPVIDTLVHRASGGHQPTTGTASWQKYTTEDNSYTGLLLPTQNQKPRKYWL